MNAVPPRPVTTVDQAPGFDEFFQEHYAPMVRLSYLLVGSRPTAEDVVQDAFARIELRWHKLRRPEVDLYRAVVVRSRRRAGRTRVPDGGGGQWVAALAALPAKRRAAVILHHYLRLTDDEIAEVLGARPRAVASMLRQARAQLSPG